MKLQETVEQLERIAEWLEGIAWIGMGLGFVYTVYLFRNLWRDQKKGERESIHKKRKNRGIYHLLLWLAAIAGGGMETIEVKAEVHTEEILPEIRIEAEETPYLERGGIWYYAKGCSICVLKMDIESEENEEKATEEKIEEHTGKTIRVSVLLKDENGEWKEADEEDLGKYDIQIEEKQKGELWKIHFSQEVQCIVTGEIWEEGREEAIAQVQQEMILDMTPPTVKETLVSYQADKRKAEQENGYYYSNEILEEEIRIEDFAGVASVICQGKKSENDEKLFEREFCEEEKIQITIPEDFLGKLEWRITDYAGNMQIWEQPEIFCTESSQKHQEHGKIHGEILETGENQAVVQVSVEDGWSGIRKIWMKKNGRIIWEEWKDNENIYVWEKTLPVPLGEEAEIYLEVFYEDRAGYSGKKELFLERKQEDKVEENPGLPSDKEEPEGLPEKQEEEVSEPWKEDKENPIITIAGVEEGKTYRGAVSLVIHIQDSWLKQERTVCILRGEKRGEIFLKKTGENQYGWETEKGKNEDDRYHLMVKAWDQAGNSAEENILFQINRQGSVFSVQGINENKMLTPENKIIIREENRSMVNRRTIMCIWEGEPCLLQENKDYTVQTQKEGERWKYEYQLNPSLFVREGRYTIHILTGDEAGNRRSNLNYFDEDGCGKKLPVEFYVEHKMEKILTKSLERGGIYFQRKENTEEGLNEREKEEKKLEIAESNEKAEQIKSEQKEEKEKTISQAKKGEQGEEEKKNSGDYGGEKNGKIMEGWKWIVSWGVLFLYLRRKKLIRQKL